MRGFGRIKGTRRALVAARACLQAPKLVQHSHKGRAGWSEESAARHKARMAATANPNWKGGRRLRTDGYIEVLQPTHPRAKSNGYVLEHVLVMEAALGRPLAVGEVVHHIDRNRTNNDPANLQVFSSQSEHLRIAHGADVRARRSTGRTHTGISRG